MKKHKIYYWMITFIFFFSACGEGVTLPVSTPTIAPTSTPIAPVSQWASIAFADLTQVGNAVGKPNTFICKTINQVQTAKTLDVYFKQPVIPLSININMTGEMHPNTTIQLLDVAGNPHDMEFSTEQIYTTCPFVYKLEFKNYSNAVAGIRITVPSGLLDHWENIDAIELTGLPVGSASDVSMSTILQKYPTPTITPTPVPVPIDERSYLDRPDDYEGKYQMHVVYALFKDDKDLHRDTDGSIARSVTLANDWFKKQTDGSFLRFDTYKGDLDITFVQFDSTASAALEEYRSDYAANHITYNLVIEDFYMNYVIEKLAERGFYQKGKYYIFYLERSHPYACGFSQISSFPGIFFLGNSNCGYGRLGVDAYAWETEFTLLHESLHGIGFVPQCAKHHSESNSYHVTDSYTDLMYGQAGAGQQLVLDVGHDDYYQHDIPNCPDLANSAFLEPLPANPEVPQDWPTDWKLP